MNRMTLETAQAKADIVKNEITAYELMRDYYRKSVEVAKKFDGKVLNKRFTTALEANITDGTSVRFLLNGHMNAFGFMVYKNNKWYDDHAVYQFYTFRGELAEIRTYNRDTNLNDKYVILFKLDDFNRINGAGWAELFESRADLMQSKINDRIPFTNPVAIMEAANKEDDIEEQIRKLTTAKSEAMPYFLRK